MDFSSMSGWDFERYCADCLLKKGFTKAEVTSGSGDHGVDIIAEQNGIRFGVQCKLYQGQIPNKAVQEAYTGASYYDCDVAVIMSNSELTKQARAEAKKLRVKFWNIADYMPEEDEKTSKIGGSHEENKAPTNYEEYVQKQKNYEHELSKRIQDELKKQESHTFDDTLLPELKTIQHREFKSAWIWLDPPNFQDETWYPFIQTIENYCSDLKNLDGASLDDKRVLFEKLSYTNRLVAFLNVIGSGLQSTLWDAGTDVVRFLGTTTVKASEINLLYWKVCYLFEQEQIVFLKIKDVIESFSTSERIKIKEISQLQQINGIENEIYDYKNTLKHLEDWWRIMPEKEESSRMDFSFWCEDNKIINQIRRNKEIVEDVYERVINYEEYRNRQIQKELEERAEQARIKREAEKERLLIKRQQEEIERKEAEQKEQERRLKEKQEAEQKERERQINEEREAERDAMVQSLVDCYNTECSKIDLEAIAARKELESRVQNEIAQAQKQIGEFLKQKEAFTLFRKKRDAELDEKISVLTRHISQLKESLSLKLEEYERKIENQRNEIFVNILKEADKEGIKEEVVNELQ